MSILRSLLKKIGLRPNSGSRTYDLEVSESLHVTLSTIAKHESRPIDELLPDLVAAGLTQYQSVDELLPKWESLTLREQEVTAYICLGYANKQIAKRLGVTEAGVKFHVHNILSKFNVTNRSKLRQILGVWDFSAWM